jgi:hypothetical protein
VPLPPGLVLDAINGWTDDLDNPVLGTGDDSPA